MDGNRRGRRRCLCLRFERRLLRDSLVPSRRHLSNPDLQLLGREVRT